MAGVERSGGRSERPDRSWREQRDGIQPRAYGDRPQRDGERRFYGDRPSRPQRDGVRRSYGDRPQREGERRSYGDRPSRPEREQKPWRPGDAQVERSTRPGQARRAEWIEEPRIPEGITGRELERDAREELRSLSKETAERVAQHLVAAGMLIDDEPRTALAHARFAARRGGRVGAVREVFGVTAYRNGDFATAIRELRTAVRITGRYDLLPMIADCERGLGRPEKALDIAASEDAEKLGASATIEMLIVVAGAYADTGDLATAIASLEIPALRQKVEGAWQVRLWVAYADLLEAAGRTDDANRWLTLAADADTDRVTDAAERLGRPAPVVEQGPWEDDEQITVLDAYVDVDEEDDGDTDEAAEGAIIDEIVEDGPAEEDPRPAEDAEALDSDERGADERGADEQDPAASEVDGAAGSDAMAVPVTPEASDALEEDAR